MIGSMAMQAAQQDLIHELHGVLKIKDAEIERLRAALGEIAMQMKTEELLEDEDGDIEGAYDAVIDVAREALSGAQARLACGEIDDLPTAADVRGILKDG